MACVRLQVGKEHCRLGKGPESPYCCWNKYHELSVLKQHRFSPFSLVQFRRSVMSNSSWPHGLQHARLPCPSPTPKAYSNSCPLSWWCHPTISSSVVPFSSCLQSFPASGYFSKSQFFPLGGQSNGVSASASVLPVNNQDCFLLGLTSWISLSLKGSQESSPTPQFKSINP